MTKAEKMAKKLKDLELGYYYCLISNYTINNDTLEITQECAVRELCYSSVSEQKYFSKFRCNEEVIAFEKINHNSPLKPAQKKFIKLN